MAFPWSFLIKLILENIQNRSGNKWAGLRAHHKTTTVHPRRQKPFFLKTERFFFGTISRYCHLFKWKDDCKSDYLLSEHQHSCSIQKLQRAFFDPVNMEMRAQRVLPLKKNSCINKSYLWKGWKIFSTKLYLSSLSWKCWKPFISRDIAESSFWWAITYSHGSGLPTFSMCQPHTEYCQVSWGRSLTNIAWKQNSSCERYSGSNFSGENQQGKKGTTYFYWQKLGRRTLQVKAWHLLSYQIMPREISKQFLHSSQLWPWSVPEKSLPSTRVALCRAPDENKRNMGKGGMSAHYQH